MKHLRVCFLSVVLGMLLVSVSGAETNPTSGAYSGFTATGTVNGESMILSGKLNQPTVKASVIRSLNEDLGASWTPKFSELTNLGAVLLKETGRNALYTESFNTPASTAMSVEDDGVYEDKGVTREERILGRDLLIWAERYDASSNKIIVDEGQQPLTRESKYVDTLTAIEAIYKAVGSVNYTANWYLRDNPKEFIPVSETPFVTSIDSSSFIYGKGYYCDVFVTRSVPDKIVAKAVEQGVLSSNYSQVKELAASQRASGKGITAGEFSLYLKRALDLYGEPVYTEAETSQWLIEYGQTLPTYLSNLELEAVKYLACRGIVDTSLDFSSNLSAQDMLTILMRAKDESSRLTFKKLTVEYDKDIVAQGFYPATISSEALDVSQPQLVLDNTTKTAIPDYFDYFVEKGDATSFVSADGKEVDSLLVAEDASNPKDLTSITDSVYLGIEDGSYHFRIPRIKASNSKNLYTYKGVQYYRIATQNSESILQYLYIPFGGGHYSYTGSLYLSRAGFSDSEDAMLFDLDRFTKAQNTTLSGKPLAKAQSFVVTFYVSKDAAKNLRWKGKPITEESSELKYNESANTVTLTLTDSNPSGVISKNLRTTSIKAYSESIPAYIAVGSDRALVSSAFFKSSAMALDFKIDSVSKVSDSVYRIALAKTTVYVDTKKKLIISGQCVTELSGSDSSPLIVPISGTSGEYYIDTRVLPLGVTNFLSNGDGSVKTLTYSSNKAVNVSYTSHIQGDSTRTSIYTDSAGRIILEGPYSLSNYLLYKKRATTYGDFLLVFTPRGSTPIDTSLNASVESLFGVKVGSNDKVLVYNLSSKATSVDNMKLFTTPSIVYDASSDTFKYSALPASQWNLSAYRNGGSNNSYPLPLAKMVDGSGFVDFNFNPADNNIDRIPAEYLNAATVKSATGVTLNSGQGLRFGSKPAADSVPKASSVTIAPIAVGTLLAPIDAIKASDVVDSRGDGTQVFYGAMAGSLIYKGDYSVKTTEGLNIPVAGTLAFSKMGNIDPVYVYCDSSTGATSASLLIKESKEALGLRESKGFLNSFNWEDFLFIQSLQDADDVLTLLYILLLGVAPRLMVMDFFALLLLSLVAPYTVVQQFASKFFDPIRVLSFGKLDVHTIDLKQMAISTFAGLVLLGMLTNESLIALYAWLVRGIQGILSR